MPDSRIYRIRKNRIEKSLMEGLNIEPSGAITFERHVPVRNLFLAYLDGGEETGRWGRLRTELTYDENMVVCIRVMACDDDGCYPYGGVSGLQEKLLDRHVSATEKKRIFESFGGTRFINRPDVLLYDLHGRYLFIYVEILGEGTGSLKNMTVDMDGDPFMNTFPEIYRENNSFFHRYMSIFSSMYGDFQDRIDRVSEQLDVDTAPPELLEIFAEWMGLEITLDHVPADKLRTLLRESYELCKYKGTRETLSRVAEILTEEKVTIVERSQMTGRIQAEDVDYYNHLYGSNPYTVTVLIPGMGDPEEHDRLEYVLKQFTPVRCVLKVVYTGTGSGLDGYSFLDTNAEVVKIREAGLDDRSGLDGAVSLK